ncbi:MAG: hypothetical protein GY754_38780, partial [bacterium]|nr:hypothetical protein [bacterium]
MKQNMTNYKSGYKTRMFSERSMLMMPMNVVMIARIKGMITETELRDATEALRKRHALLAVRVYFDEHGYGWYTTDNVPEIPVRVVESTAADSCEKVIESEWKNAFPYEKGPLARLTLVKNGSNCELVVTGHHVICDGTSLIYLIRDILSQLGKGKEDTEVLPPPPPITSDTVPNPGKMKPIQKLIMKIISKKWNKAGIRLDQKDMERMLSKFWKQNSSPSILRWELSQEETKDLVTKCRQENVTVNSALWVAFLSAQYKVQGDKPAFRKKAGMAVSTRDNLKVSVGESFGFYASSLNLTLKHNPGLSFWDNARQVHKAIHKELNKTDIFRMLVTETLPPTLLDSFYFNKYDGLDNRLAQKMLKQLKWNKISFGYSITNVGRVNINTEYGNRKLEAVYGPLLYSDVNEKVVGITTVGGRLTFSMSCGADNVGREVIDKIREQVMQLIREECIISGKGD